jgi:predicted enzyme related to lactoylglutathione lyase
LGSCSNLGHGGFFLPKGRIEDVVTGLGTPIAEELGFEVVDIKKTLTTMKKAGVTITDEPIKFNENTIIAFVEDPDGTLIELIQHS